PSALPPDMWQLLRSQPVVEVSPDSTKPFARSKDRTQRARSASSLVSRLLRVLIPAATWSIESVSRSTHASAARPRSSSSNICSIIQTSSVRQVVLYEVLMISRPPYWPQLGQ